MESLYDFGSTSARTAQTLPCRDWKTTPLSEYLERQEKGSEMGTGIRKWALPCSSEHRVGIDFGTSLKQKILRRYWKRDGFGSSADSVSSVVRDGVSLKKGSSYDVPDYVVKERIHKFLNYSEDSITSDVEGTKRRLEEQRDENLMKIWSSSEMSAFFSDLMEDSSRQYVTLEGRPCSKQMLMELIYKFCNLKDSTSGTKFCAVNSSTQTTIESTLTPVPTTVSTECQSVPDSCDKATCTSVDNVMLETTNAGATVSNQVKIVSDVQPNNQPLPSLLGTPPAPQNFTSNSYQSYPSHYYNQSMTNNFLNARKFEQAKNWQPQTDDQIHLFEQTKLDMYNVLLVAKGCALKYLKRQFYLVTQENLNFEKMGLPDLRTLLVQMKDFIVLKRQRYTGEYFVFPNLQKLNNEFETGAHIAELVAEQRNKDLVPLPDQSLLVECDISELFIEENRYTPYYNLQQTTYSRSAADPNWRVNGNYLSNYHNNGLYQNFGGINGSSYINYQQEQLRKYQMQMYYGLLNQYGNNPMQQYNYLYNSQQYHK